MLNRKIKSMKLSHYFEVKKPNYQYIKIIPHKSIRNYSSVNIAKSIANTYKSINKRVYRENKKLIFEMDFKISYLIDITNTDTSFYLVVPKFFLNIALEKIHEVWTKATIEVIGSSIQPFSKDVECYSLSYKKHDALSLNVDKKLNEPLNSILSVIEIMKENDRVMIAYNFIPRSQFGWIETFDELEEKVRKKESLDKPVLNFEYILKNATLNVIKAVDLFVEVINDFFGGLTVETKSNMYDSMFRLLENQNDISNSRYKKTSQVINTQIAILSESVDSIRKSNNALSLCQAFRTLDCNNELKYEKVKNSINIEDYSFKKYKSSAMSTAEVGQLMQIPGRMLLTTLGIKHVKTEEVKVPEKLQTGTHRLGTSKYKGNITPAYFGKEYNIASLPLVLFGMMGGGKSTFLANFAKDSIDNGEGVIVIDFIKKCELSDDIKAITPSEKLIEIDLSKMEDLQGLGYDELKIPENANILEIEEMANLQTTQLQAFINSIVIGDPLSSRMETILGAAGDITFSLGYTAIKDVIKCLTCHKTRMRYIEELKQNKELYESLDEEVETLMELNEWSKVSAKDAKEGVIPEIIGTRENKIEHILDRTRVLRRDTKLKYMYRKDTKDNIDLVKAMDDGKVVLFKMPQAKFPSKRIKNIIVTYLMSKIWLALEQRGAKTDKPRRCNIIVDEIHQAPTVFNDLRDIITQTRKFGGKLIFALHHTSQLEQIEDTLESAGTSYMLLNGCLEDDFNHFKSKLGSFEYEDLRDMDQYCSMNLIKYSDGYASFITKLPEPVKGS
ncbi:type IV secretion system DNA-binding domain-containing protein [Clostridium thermobutyricum]|uniref:type IV secretion system DNA-binding domain-containing protein n=1 Tax=Clostridium thermobutyricum TaxID=29372 RepID=UPI0018AC51AF|nr:type IV secretion system DNA-binding domain-containing protein [Clostridium thermobutyricum]